MQRVKLSCDKNSTEVSVRLQGAPEQGAPMGTGPSNPRYMLPSKALFSRNIPREGTVPQHEPAHYDDPLVIVGTAEMYEARCRKHHIVPGKH